MPNRFESPPIHPDELAELERNLLPAEAARLLSAAVEMFRTRKNAVIAEPRPSLYFMVEESQTLIRVAELSEHEQADYPDATHETTVATWSGDGVAVPESMFMYRGDGRVEAGMEIPALSTEHLEALAGRRGRLKLLGSNTSPVTNRAADRAFDAAEHEEMLAVAETYPGNPTPELDEWVSLDSE